MSSSALQALLLDLDGTLIEPEHEFLHSEISRVLAPLGFTPPDKEDLLRAHARGVLWEWLPAEDRKRLVVEFWKDYRAHLYPHPRVMRGVPETLKKLRENGLKLIVVTFRSDTTERVIQLLTECRLMPLLDGAYSVGELARVTPDKSGIITQALNDFSIHPHEAAIVGDSAADIMSGKVCGLRHSIAVETGGHDYDYLESLKADYILSHIAELPGLLRALNADAAYSGRATEPS